MALGSTKNGTETISFREVITLEQAIGLPEAGELKNLAISQITDADIRPLAMALLGRDIGIAGVNYGTKKDKIVAELRPAADEKQPVDN